MRYNDLLTVWQRLDRSLFLDGDSRKQAYVDAPLSIGYGQTISQPTLVFEMTRLLDPDPACRVLEIGTGSGYQSALLSPFSARVFTMERVIPLAERARERLEGLGYKNITFLHGDGSLGWPPALVDQLAPGGRMVIPVGPRHAQDLLLVTRDREGIVRSEAMMKVVFVELILGSDTLDI